MTKKIGDKKVTSVKSSEVKETGGAEQIKESSTVGQVGKVQGATGVAGAGSVGAVGKRRATRVMSYAEREEYFRMVEEEAEKMFAGSGMTPEKQKLVAQAVKMAIDSGLTEEQPTSDANSSKPKK